MDFRVDSVQGGNIKRIRQACASCRKKKTKCSGERPICFHCRRNKRSCVYEPYSATVGDQPPTSSLVGVTDNAELLQRISTIESRLAELSGQTGRRSASDSSSLEDFSSNDTAFRRRPSVENTYNAFPPSPVLQSLIDTYFLRVHNQPYSYFQESLFRQRLDNNLLPRCLVFAVLASAVRFSTHEYFNGRTHEASETYARESWLAVLADHLTVEDSMNVHVVQAVNLLAIVDYTAGRVSSGWLKIGLAARISQDLHLMTEPEGWLSYTEQEERRRAFWSAYLVDKLISCGQSRPLAILDEDCNVQLPCDEQTFRDGQWKKTPTIGQLLSWNTDVSETPSPFALTILMASIFGRCTRYFHQKRGADEIPPWDTKSEFASITSSLLFLETYSHIGSKSISDLIHENLQPDGTVDHQQVGHLVFAHAIFHLCHCLLNHPFSLRLRLRPFGSKTPASFVSRALQGSGEHARQLLDLLKEASDSGCFIESSFYAYCIAIPGGILSLYSHLDIQSGSESSDALNYFQESVDALDRLGRLWTHASNMAIRLREFHAQSYKYTHLLDPASQIDDLDPATEGIFWSMVDYGKLGSSLRRNQNQSDPSPSNMPSPSWLFNPEAISGLSPRLPSGGEFLDTGTPSMRLNEVEYLLNCTPTASGLL
ncbi:hypothetical protein AWENTII_012129 [Aspergillus wentii]